jgi:hypothetical protein
MIVCLSITFSASHNTANDCRLTTVRASAWSSGAEQAPTLGPGWNASQASGVAVAGGRVVVATAPGSGPWTPRPARCAGT